MATICSVCGDQFVQTPGRLRKRDYRCRACCRNSELAWRHRRKEQGRPVKSTVMPHEYFVRYEADYGQLGYVKAKRVAMAKARFNDPVHRPKIMARVLLRRAVAAGRVIKLPCVICGSTRSQGHHEDYARPLAVQWLCAKHHHELHRKARGDQPDSDPPIPNSATHGA